MQEQSEVRVWWNLDVGDAGEFKVTEAQMQAILKADRINARFVAIDGAVLNVAFIRSAIRYKVTRNEHDISLCPLSEHEKKFLVKPDNLINLGGNNE